MRLLLLGCTGFIGQELVPRLIKAGHQLILVSRQAKPFVEKTLRTKQIEIIQLDPSNPEEWEDNLLIDSLTKSEGIINLAGEPIAEKRWSKEHCQIIENSRLNTTISLIKAMHQVKANTKVLVNGSAIGYYGSSENKKFTEENPPGKDFLARLCQKWEASALQKPQTTRLVNIRIGIVLGPNGGALKKMIPIFRMGLGGPIGNGQQWMSWIHRTDICKIIENALINSSWEGSINCVSPEPTKMYQFASKLGSCMGRPSILRVPESILKLILGDGAKVVLEGQYVESNKLQKLGYKFEYPNLSKALAVATLK
tara:strand:- start:45 stop:977 length:933 start_codon:yes stop_codon:yes gene_type:complete